MVIVVLGLLSAVALPHLGDVISSGKESATRREMQIIIGAIVGDSQSERTGYENDLGAPPPDLEALVDPPEGVSAFDRFTGLGWNGPYLEDDIEAITTDAWGLDYEYDASARTLTSQNPENVIQMSF